MEKARRHARLGGSRRDFLVGAAATGAGVILLEARDRVGGRVLNHRVQRGVIAELGGQWVGPTQDRVLALAEAVGVRTFPTYNHGENVRLLDGRRSRYWNGSMDGAVRSGERAADEVLDALGRGARR